MVEKTESTPEGQLAAWLDQIPEEVQTAADAYDEAHQAQQEAKAATNSAREKVIETMKEHDCQRVPIRNGEKILTLGVTDKVTIEKPTKPESDLD